MHKIKIVLKITKNRHKPGMFGVCLNHYSIAMERHHDGNSYKGNHLVGADCSFRGLEPSHHGKEWGCMQADMMLEEDI